LFKDRETETKYNGRMRRYAAAMAGGVPDRIPIRFFFQEAAARHAGYSNQQVACDYEKAFEATRLMAEDVGSDAVMPNAIWSNYGLAKSASWKYLHVPGVDIDVDAVNQFSEPSGESEQLMLACEYDEFIGDPTAFILTKWFPRATTRLAAPGSPATFEHNAALISGALSYAGYMNSFGPAIAKLKYESGIVCANSGMLKAPLDIFADKFRGYMGAAIDAIERPAEVYKACEALMPHILAIALAGADPERLVPLTIWAHRGCVPFFNKKIFDTIYWPTLKPVFEELISRGHRILFYGEGNWEAHYDSLMELPEGSVIYHLDKGDRAVAARAFKGRFAISGGLPYDVLARGTPYEVRSEMKSLFDVMKPGGGYILDCSALMLSDVAFENVKAAAEYAMEYGVYSQASPEAAEWPPPPSSAPPYKFPQGLRPPNTVRTWEEESAGYRNLSGDTGLVRGKWMENDAAAYNYLWTTVLW